MQKDRNDGNRAAGMVYEPSRDRIFVWGGAAKVWEVDPATWDVVLRTTTGPAPSCRVCKGNKQHLPRVGGKWQYLETFPDGTPADVFIGHNDAFGGIWLWKP